MVAYTKYMKQIATYWAPGTPDGFGSLGFAAVTPVLISCRWQNVTVLFRDNNGNEVTSSAVVYPAQALLMRGYLFEGDETANIETDPRKIAGTFEIRQVGTSPDMKGNEVLNKVWL